MGSQSQADHNNTMVAAQVFIALCAASLAVAAPQLNLPGLRSVNTISSNVNEQEVVSSVVTALGPSISQAVSDALASLEAAAAAEAAAAEEAARLAAEEQARVEAEARARAQLAAQQRAAAEQAARRRAAAEQAARQRAAAEQAAREQAAAAAAQAAAEPTARPVYNFEYKVADNEFQTYISQSEERDGDALTGTYSYVNPVGSLITVNYQAGPEGYTQTSSEKAGFVDIRAQPVRSNAAAEEAARIAAQQAAAQRARVEAQQRARAESARLVAEQRAAAEAARFAAEQRAAEEAARLAAEQAASQQSLISRIISSLQPQISSAVQSAISTTQTVVAPVPVARAVASGDLSSTFGDGFSVKIGTPEFNIQY